MSENSAEVKFGGDASGAVSASADAAKAVKDAVGHMTETLGSLGNSFGAVKGMLLGLTAALGSFAVIKEASDETLKFTKEANALGRALNVSANEAAVLIDALEDIGSNGDEYTGAFVHFARQLKTNGAELRAMGVDVDALKNGTKSSNEVFREALQIVSQYKPGLDQAQASMAMFGRSIESVLKLQKLSNEKVDESREKLKSLGLTLTKEGQESAEKYRNAMRDMGDVFTGIKKAIGDAFMPILTKLADWFNSIGPAAVAATRVAVDTLATGFWLLKHAVTVAWEVINAMVITVAEPIRAVAESVYHLLNGNYSAAGSAITKVPKEISAAWQQANKEVNASASELDKKIGNLWGSGTPTEANKGGNKSYTSQESKDKRAADQKALNEAIIEGERALSREELETRRATLDQMAAMGQISREEQLIQLKALKEQEFLIDTQALEQKLALAKEEGKERQKILDQIALAKQKHATDMIKLDQQAFLEMKAKVTTFISPVTSAFNTAINGVIQGTTTLKQAVANMAQSIALSFLNMGIQKLGEFIAEQIAGVLIAKTAAEKEGMAYAGSGAAAAMASVAAIPYIGWAMAPEVGDAHFAMASGLVKAGMSAEGGFDIPAGMNPVTQLHQKEMVLPAEHADTIRSMAGNGGAGGPVVHIHTAYADARGIRDLFTKNGDAMARGLRDMNRRFVKA